MGFTRIDRPTMLGIAGAALAVAAFSAWSQFEMARLAGTPVALAWVLPVATDACGFVASRVWISEDYTSGVRRYAAVLTLSAALLSILSAGTHLVLVDVAVAPLWLRLAIGGLPSAALAALIHLAALVASDRSRAGRSEKASTPRRRQAPVAAGSPPAPAATGPIVASSPEPEIAPMGLRVVQGGGEASFTDAEIAAGRQVWDTAAAAGRQATVTEIREALRIGRSRAMQLRRLFNEDSATTEEVAQ